MIVDPHVHLRDWSQSHKETLFYGLRNAWLLGISGLFEMPNTEPPLIHEPEIRTRLHEADEARALITKHYGAAPFHGLYIGLTQGKTYKARSNSALPKTQPKKQWNTTDSRYSTESGQIAKAVALHKELFPRVVGFKFYTSHTTGSLGIVDPRAQRTIYADLVQERYRGVLAVHCEHEHLFKPTRWNPHTPHSHSAVQPWRAEYQSVKDHINMATQEGFLGTLYICHVSSPYTMRYIAHIKPRLPFRLVFGLTPHHLIWNTRTSKKLSKITPSFIPRDDTTLSNTMAFLHNATPALLKVNPPLRSKNQQRQLYRYMHAVARDIPILSRTHTPEFWIESDHAPHTYYEKLSFYHKNKEYRRAASGFPGLRGMTYLYRRLQNDPRVSQNQLNMLFYTKVCDVFGIDPRLFPHNPRLDTNKSHDDISTQLSLRHAFMYGKKHQIPQIQQMLQMPEISRYAPDATASSIDGTWEQKKNVRKTPPKKIRKKTRKKIRKKPCLVGNNGILGIIFLHRYWGIYEILTNLKITYVCY